MISFDAIYQSVIDFLTPMGVTPGNNLLQKKAELMVKPEDSSQQSMVGPLRVASPIAPSDLEASLSVAQSAGYGSAGEHVVEDWAPILSCYAQETNDVSWPLSPPADLDTFI